MEKRCLVVGDLNIDLIINEIDGFPKLGNEILANNYYIDIGGIGGIFSAFLSALGTDTGIIAKIGGDFLGNYLQSRLRIFNVDLNYIILVEENTGITVNLSYLEDKAQISSVGIVYSLNKKDIVIDKLRSIDHERIHYSSYYLMSQLKDDYLKIIKGIKSINSAVTFSMDTNDDPSREWNSQIIDILKEIDIFFVNEKEALNITKKRSVLNALDMLSGFTETAVIKLGDSGYVAKQYNDFYEGEPLKVNFKDSTGTGDNFDAGFIYGFLNNLHIENCLKIANICGGVSTEYLGGVGPLEKYERIKKIIRE